LDNLYIPGRKESSSLLDRYLRAVQRRGLHPDQEQMLAVREFGRLWEELSVNTQSRWWPWRSTVSSQGIYLWGEQERGKTWLMDFFFDAIPRRKKRRIHFPYFMEDVHRRLAGVKRLSYPLQQVVKDLAYESPLLCLDDFHVHEVDDAVILAELLQGLFHEGVTLVATASQPPEDLYRHGVQRLGFLPAINLLKEHTRVIELGSERDFRREISGMASTHYHSPVDELAELRMAEAFIRLASGRTEADGNIGIQGRAIPFSKRAEGVIWFEFDALCGPMRARNDFIEIARRHHTLFLSNVPRMDGSRDDRVRRFIFLVDECYDHRVKLVISSNFEPERLYCGEGLAFEFKRTITRLREMQTLPYLGSSHRD